MQHRRTLPLVTLLGAALLLQLVGVLWIRSIINIDI